MNAEVTNPASTYMLPPTIGSVSAFDPDRGKVQLQPDFLLPPEPQYTTTSFRSFDNIKTSSDYLTGSFKLSKPIAPLTGLRDFDIDMVFSLYDLPSLIDPRDRFIAELAQKETRAREMYHAYMLRIEVLRSEALLDGFSVNAASEEDFWSFVESISFAQKVGLVLMDNGNLRAVWKGENGSHLGLQFLGNRLVEYVIFQRRRATRDISRVAGRDTIEGIKRQIRAFDLTVLMDV